MIEMSEYAKRRAQLLQGLPKNSVVILAGAKEIIRNGDSHYHFRQDSDFYYLTGFNEPDAILLLSNRQKATGEFILFNRVRDPDREVWDGPRSGQLGACQEFGADQAYPDTNFSELLPSLLDGSEMLYYPIGRQPHLDKIIMHAIEELRREKRQGKKAPQVFMDVLPIVHEMRLFKSPAEIAMIQKAVDISAFAHIAAIKACKADIFEYELDAILSYEFMRRGAQYSAYSSIVGAGKNSCVLHYVSNSEKIHSNDLVLIDAGCEFANYASDITRTIPASSKFSTEARAIYELVLKAQLAAIATVKPGALWSAPQDAIIKIMTQGLLELGILKGELADLIKERAYFPFYMHGSGHFLGLDVHDAGDYKVNGEWRAFEKGMVLTVEPGIYISAEHTNVDKRWHHIGVRIEDDILVTATGNQVLSAHIPKTVSDIEALMGR